MNANRTTAWQTVLQSQTIHPDWTSADHLVYLAQEGHDLAKLYGGTPEEIIAGWLAQNIVEGRVDALQASASNDSSPTPAFDAMLTIATDGCGHFIALDPDGQEIERVEADDDDRKALADALGLVRRAWTRIYDAG